MKKIFFILCLLGVILPYYHLINFLQENNWSMTGFLDQLYSNHAISMITMDITVAATSFLVYLIYQLSNKKISTMCFVKYIVSLFIVGFSLSLPLYLYDNYKK
tara:strand:+ start:21 stop:329 length:309 start_codon:yes stop_codon:yes gene_type:complete